MLHEAPWGPKLLYVEMTSPQDFKFIKYQFSELSWTRTQQHGVAASLSFSLGKILLSYGYYFLGHNLSFLFALSSPWSLPPLRLLELSSSFTMRIVLSSVFVGFSPSPSSYDEVFSMSAMLFTCLATKFPQLGPSAPVEEIVIPRRKRESVESSI